MTPSPREPDTCVVCGKDTSHGRGFMRLFENGRPIELCCPMCLKVYQERLEQAKADRQNNDGWNIGWDKKW